MNSHLQYRYRGSQPFQDTDLDRKIFFGREQEIQTFLHLVLAENVVVLFAKSGIGKTSLLNAGIFQPLRERHFLPLLIRCNSPQISPLQSIYSGIRNIVDLQRIEYTPGEENTLWQYFKTVEFWSVEKTLLTPVLIFDQFEEFFTLHPLEKRNACISQLADVMKSRAPQELRRTNKELPYTETPPDVKIIFSLREDFLGDLQELSQALPGIVYNRFRLLPLTREKATQAILNPAALEDSQLATKTFTYRPETIDAFLDFLCKRREGERYVPTDEVEPFQLQLICQHIEKLVAEKTKQGENTIVIKEADLGGETGMQRILEDFYDQILSELDLNVRKRVRNFCERGLISISDRRLSLEEEEIQHRFEISKELLDHLIQYRLLRSEPRLGSIYYELSHDTLIAPIRKSQKKRETRKSKIRKLIIIGAIMFFIFGLAAAGFSLRKFYYYYRGNKYYEQKNYAQAGRYFERVTELDPAFASAYIGLANIMLAQGKSDEAIAPLEKAIELERSLEGEMSKKFVKNFMTLGDTLAKQGKEQDALEYYRVITQLAPDNVEAYKKSGDIFFKFGEYTQAIEQYLKLLEFAPEEPDIQRKLGDAYLAQRRYVNAMKAYEQALQANIDDAEAYRGRGDVLIVHEKYQDAFEQYQHALVLDPENARAYAGSGDVLFFQHRYTEALEHYRKALELMPDDANLYRKIGDVLSQQNQYADAIPSYNEALKRAPTDVKIYQGLGDAFFDLGHYENAEEMYNRVFDLEPLALTSKLNLVKISLITENFYKAIALAEELQEDSKFFTPPEEKLATRFLSIAALLFLKESDPSTRIVQELEDFHQESGSVAEKNESFQQWEGLRRFIERTHALSEKDKQLLFDLLTILESPES